MVLSPILTPFVSPCHDDVWTKTHLTKSSSPFRSFILARNHAEISPKREQANVTFDGHCNGRIRVSTLRYSETFYPPGRNTFDLIFFSFLPPIVLSPGRRAAEETGGLVVRVQGHVGDADESERIFRYQLDRKNRNKTEGNCMRVSATRGRWYWPKFDDTRSRLR